MRPRVIVLVLLVAISFLGLLASEYVAVHDEGSIAVVFCPACESAFLAAIAQGEVQCALYDNGEKAGAALAAVQANVLTDDETTPVYGKPYKHSGLMHNKFCIINQSVVLTGSYNPTDGGERSKNNVLLIHSKALAKNYRKEFASMQERSVRESIQHVLWINGTRVENYFCPADECERHVLDALGNAQESVVFMAYSFTSDPIGELLMQKKVSGVAVEGVCDSSQNDQYTECNKLSAEIYRGEGLMHHKVFIIDGKRVITGSYNPTANADRRNKENILIIDSPFLAQQYREEYQRVLAEA